MSENDNLDEVIKERDRAREIGKQLFSMVPKDLWKNTGGDDGQGHYEGEYLAERLEQEILSWDLL